MSISIESLKIFCDVVRKRSFSKGAALNSVSQSAASQVVCNIEKRLGVKLINRSKRPLSLTPEGQIYYDGCRNLISQYAFLESRIHSLHDDSLNSVTVASIYSVGLYDMSRYERRFSEIYPNGKVKIEYMHPDKVYERVLNEDADFGLISFPRPSRNLKVVPWKNEQMVLVCSPEHRLAKYERIDIRELNGESFIAFEQGLDIRKKVEQYLRSRYVDVRIVMEFDNIEAIKRGIEINAGVSILPRPSIANELILDSLVEVQIEGSEFVREMNIICRRGRILTPAAASFLKLLGNGNNEMEIKEEQGLYEEVLLNEKS